MTKTFSLDKHCLKELENLTSCSYTSEISDGLATVTELIEFCRDGNSIEGFVDELISVARLIRSYKAIADGISSDANEFPHQCEITDFPGTASGLHLCTTIEEWFEDNNSEPGDYLFDIREAMATLLQDDGAAQETKKKLGGVFQRIGFLVEGLQAIMINNR